LLAGVNAGASGLRTLALVEGFATSPSEFFFNLNSEILKHRSVILSRYDERRSSSDMDPLPISAKRPELYPLIPL